MELKEYAAIGEKVFVDVLDNGLKYFFVQKPDFNRNMAFFATHYGGADRRFRLGGKWVNTPAGVAHFLEHKLFDMEDGRNALTVLTEAGASANAFTSTDMTAYHFESVDGFRENLKTLLHFVSVPYFTRESVSKEQGIIGQEIGMVEDEPDYCVYYGLLRQLFKHNPMRDPVAGSVASIAEITPATLYTCHKVFYDPSNMALVIVGSGDAEEMRDLAEEVLPGGSGLPPVCDHGQKETHIPKGSRVSKKMAVGMPMFYSGVRTASDLHGRQAHKYELTASLALSTLMGRASPLFSRLYEKGYINDTFSADFEMTAGVSFAAFGGESREPDAVTVEVLKAARRFAKDGPDRELFMRRKKAAIGQALKELNSFDDICFNVADGAFSGYDYFETVRIISEITEEDVMKFVAESLTPEKIAMSVIDTMEE